LAGRRPVGGWTRGRRPSDTRAASSGRSPRLDAAPEPRLGPLPLPASPGRHLTSGRADGRAAKVVRARE
jgi:hypothetical protein